MFKGSDTDSQPENETLSFPHLFASLLVFISEFHSHVSTSALMQSLTSHVLGAGKNCRYLAVLI